MLPNATPALGRRGTERKPVFVRQQNEHRESMSTEQRQSTSSSGARAWKFRCADCGASWDVTALMILESNDWTRCPNCDGQSLRDDDQTPAENG